MDVERILAEGMKGRSNFIPRSEESSIELELSKEKTEKNEHAAAAINNDFPSTPN